MPRPPARTGLLALAATLALALGGGAATGSAASRARRTASGSARRHCPHRSSSPAHRARVVWTSAFPRSQELTFASAAASSSPRRGAHSSTGGCRAGRHRPAAKHGVSPTAPGTSGPVDSNNPSGAGGAPQATPPSGSTPPSEGGTGESSAPPSIPHVQVTAFEYGFILSRTSVPAGKVAFNFVNSGQDEHNFNALSGEGQLAGQLPNTESKGVRNLTIEMRHGKFTLFCSLPEHESKGMKATLTVE